MSEQDLGYTQQELQRMQRVDDELSALWQNTCDMSLFFEYVAEAFDREGWEEFCRQLSGGHYEDAGLILGGALEEFLRELAEENVG